MKEDSRAYNELNDLQRQVVDTIDGPLLVLAGPGTGKTQLLSVRAGNILGQRNADPSNILILTYTNSAAQEMKERLAKIIGLKGYDVEVATFHSFANSVIQESEEAANYVGDRIQMTDIEQVRAVEYILDHAEGIGEIRPFRAPYLYMKEILRRISEFRRDGITPDHFDRYLAAKKEWDAYLEDKHIQRLRALATVYRMYEELKEGKHKEIFDERGRYDFDDMILFATEAFRKESVLKDEYQARFKYVMVDEYQDTNGAQLELLFTLLDYKAPNLCCVGDDDQSIYRFQGASVGNFRILKEHFPDIKTFSLKENYRSSKELIDLSAKIIAMIPQKERAGEKALRPVKEYRDKEMVLGEFTTEDEELLYIVEKIAELRGTIARSSSLSPEERKNPYNAIAILVRKRDDILKVVDALLQAGIPYATDGKEDISAEKRVKQLLDVLDLAHLNPNDYDLKDLALYKVLTADYFEIPLTDIFKFAAFVNAKKERSRSRKEVTLLSEFLACFSSKKAALGLEHPERLRAACTVIQRLLDEAKTATVHSLLLDFINGAGVFEYVLREYKEREVIRIRELRALTSFINMIKSADLSNPAIRLGDFMAEVKTRKDHGLSIRGKLVTLTQNGIRVLTAHASKGQEFHTIFMPFCLQNKNWPVRQRPEMIPLPSDLFATKESSAERQVRKELFSYDEIRLFYVAMTRAKSNIIFTASPTESAVTSSYLKTLGIDEKLAHLTEEETITKFLRTTDERDPLIGTEAVIADMIKNMTLNPTRVNNYLRCRRKFFYNDVLKLPAPKKKSLVFGNCVHKALEETYLHLRRTTTFPPFKFFLEAFDRELRFQGVDRSIELQCRAKDQIAKLREWYEIAARSPVVPIGLEKKLVVTIGDNIIFTGKYDKLEWQDEKAGRVRIIDYKTGKPDDHLKAMAGSFPLADDSCDGYLRQLVAYKLLFEKDTKESRGRKVASGALVFIEPLAADIKKLGYQKGQHVTKVVEISDAMVGEMEDVIKKAWDDVTHLRFEKLKERDEGKCGKCEFEAICWK